MVTIQRATRTPHVAILTGTDAVAPDGTVQVAAVKAALFDDRSPLGDLAGEVDFVVCVVAGHRQGMYFGGSRDHGLQPRPFRGVAQVGDLADPITPASLGAYIGGSVAHEVAHYWLAPGRAAIRVAGATAPVETPTSADLIAALAAGRSMPDYPIMARQDAHWSPYLDGQGSPMDGITHVLVRHQPHLRHVRCQRNTGPSYHVPGFGTITTPFRFSPLELHCMGVRPPARTAGVVNAVWTYPLPFQSGLFIDCDDGSRWYLGFDGRPDRIAATRIDGAGVGAPASIDLAADAWPGVPAGLAIVREHGALTLRAMWDPRLPTGGPLDVGGGMLGSGVPWPLDPVVVPGQPSRPNPWVTLATVPGTATRMGVSTRTGPGVPTFVRTAARLWLVERAGTPEASVAALDVTTLARDVPSAGPIVLPDGRLVVPYWGPTDYQESATRRDAPRLWHPVPAGDFFLSSIVDLEACTLCNWAGGDAVGRNLIGVPQDFAIRDFVLPEDHDGRVRRRRPLDDTYRTLVCLVGRDPIAPDDPHLDTVDTIRRAWQAYFPRVVPGRAVDTRAGRWRALLPV